MKRFYTFFLMIILLNGWLSRADAQIVRMPDANLAAAVRDALNLRPDATITRQGLQDLTILQAPESNISDLTGLEHATRLRWLWMWENEVSDLTPLAGLTNLRSIDLSNNQISDVTPLAGLTGLGSLQLGNNQISDITPLARLTQLEWISLWQNEVSDITPLANMTELGGISFGGNEISDITPLANMTRLESLWIWGNEISDITPLVRLTRLTRLDIGRNQIEDIGVVARFPRLEMLIIGDNNISDLTPVTNLTRLERLSAWENEISDITPLKKLGRLRHLDFNDNFIVDITPVAGLRLLEELRLRNNSVQDVSPLRRLTRLKDLRLEGNPIQDVAPLRTLLDQYPGLKLDVNIAELAKDIKPIVKGYVKMPDANLAAAVRKALGLGAKARISKQAILELTHLKVRDSNISDLTGLQDATQLTELYLERNEISDVSPLARLTRLRRLRLEDNEISNIQPLTGLTRLEELYLGDNQINNAEVRRLTKLKQLRWLSLYNNQISNITPLAKLTKLEKLRLSNNKIRDVSPLSGLVKLEALHLKGNPITNFSPLASLTNLTDADFLPAAGPKIEGPWLWMIVPTWNRGGKGAATSGRDYLAVITKGAVTEVQIATRGATLGDRVKNRKWTLGRLSPTGRNNITEMVNAIGLGKGGNIDRHVAYGSIALRSPRKQNTTMHVGSDDAVKVWLNGELVHENPINRSADDYQESFPVTLKQGKNILLVAVYEMREAWSGFFGFEEDAVYSVITTSAAPAKSAHAAIPDTTGLLSNYPNPFNPETWIPYELATETHVEIHIYDARGILVRSLELGYQPAGTYTRRSRAAYWDGRNALGERVASGIYFYQLQADALSPLRKMVILK